MPGNVGNAAVGGPPRVMPHSVSTGFRRVQSWPADINEYANGERQSRSVTGNYRATWELAKKLTYAELDTLRDFYEACDGEHLAFYFYDAFEGDHDPSGVSPTGRKTVRFAGPWSQTIQLGFAEVSITLVEVA